MKMPSISITFTELAATSIARGERGVIAMIMKDTEKKFFSMSTIKDIPAGTPDANKKQIELAFMGYVNPPQKVIVHTVAPTPDYSYTAVTPDTGDNPHTEGWYESDGTDYTLSSDTMVDSLKTYYEKEDDTYTAVEDPDLGDDPSDEGWYVSSGNTYTAATDTRVDTSKTYYSRTATGTTTIDYGEALDYLSTARFDYLVCPTVKTDDKVTEIVNYVKAERAADKLIKAVLPETLGDHEGIINFATPSVTEDNTTYTAEQYCSRIAGIIAGTPLTMSATYAPMMELTDCTRLSKADADTAVGAGKLIAFFDGEKVKLGRAVNSLTTTTQSKNTQFQKIKIVDIMDIIANDIRVTIEDSYIGKYANTYSNKVLLISAISDYLDRLVRDNIIEGYDIGIDTEANASYLAGRGVDTDSMGSEALKKANTGSHVFLKASLSILDAIEDVEIPITI